MSTCFHIHTYMSVSVYVYKHLYIHMFVFVHVSVCMFVSRSLGMYLCVYVFVYIYRSLCMHMCYTRACVCVQSFSVCMCVSVQVCMEMSLWELSSVCVLDYQTQGARLSARHFHSPHLFGLHPGLLYVYGYMCMGAVGTGLAPEQDNLTGMSLGQAPYFSYKQPWPTLVTLEPNCVAQAKVKFSGQLGFW